MAKKKAANAATKAADSRSIVVSMKGTPEFRDWLNKLADHERTTAVQILEKAVVDYAKRVGFADIAPKRTEGR